MRDVLAGGIMEVVVFYLFALITVVSAVVVVFSPNLIYAVFSLLFTFFGLAGLYVFLQADFIAAVQVLVYVGGTLVLLLFGVMLTHHIKDIHLHADTFQRGPGIIGALVVFATLCMVIFGTNWSLQGAAEFGPTTRTLGELLLGPFLLLFEVASVLLLAALVGAAFLARRRL